MPNYRNINAILKDAIPPITTIISSGTVLPIQDLPSLHDEVSLDTDEGYSMSVEVLSISDDGKTLRGKVTRGYYSSDKSREAPVGDFVSCSITKIKGIHKK